MYNDHGCSNKLFRPDDSDMNYCDNWCCRQGYLTGKILKKSPEYYMVIIIMFKINKD
jgi:hypothetical protein